MPRERRVYIVDDDEAVRDSLSVLLESKAYAVRSFGSAPEFLTAAPSLPIGCLIADIRMPEMDGLELQQHLIDRSLQFPLIVITGHGDVPLAVRAMKVGAVDFIEKPVALEAILDSLEVALLRLTTPGEEDPVKSQPPLSSPCSRRASSRCWKASSPDCQTKRLPAISQSVRARSRSIARV
jgi:two-component system, LuxR family, response regulator FixJ